MADEQPLSLAAFQQHIRDRYDQTDRARGTAATFMWFIEEVGELATALQESNGDVVNPPPPEVPEDLPTPLSPAGVCGDGRDNLEGEFADVLAWLCTLANINGVDLAGAVHKKYLAGPGPIGHK